MVLAMPTPARISSTAMSRLLRVGVTGTFLELNQAADVPDGGSFPRQRGQGAPQQDHGAQCVGGPDERGMAHFVLSRATSRTQPLRRSCSNSLTRVRVNRFAA